MAGHRGFQGERILKMVVASVKHKRRDDAMTQALAATAAMLDIDAAAVERYANEDPFGGWDHGAGTYPKGCIWRAEGQALYALVRALRPRRVADLGTHVGASATHLAAAVQANGTGRVVTVDRGFGDVIVSAGEALLREGVVERVVIRSRDPWLLREARRLQWRTEELVPRAPGAKYYGGLLLGYRGAQRVVQLPGDVALPFPGHLIPEPLRSHCALVIAEAARWLETGPALDFVFEDLDHSRTTTSRVARLIKQRLIPGGILVCHDALHPRHGPHVRRGLGDAGLRPIVCVRIGRSDCGFAVWRKPHAGDRAAKRPRHAIDAAAAPTRRRRLL